MNPPADASDVHEVVRQGYARIARGEASSCCEPSASPSTGGCCNPGLATSQFAAELGYSHDELSQLPEGANLGLSCGNPTALAGLEPGETLLDLGSGAGLDVFVASPRLGPTGRAIGVDMTPEMLVRARRNAGVHRERTGLDNVEFRLGEIEHLPVADSSVDVVVSNCVLNLSPDKKQVWREIARVLKPGGRVAVSDLALLQPLPPAVREMVEALVGCVAGAALVKDTQRMASMAGLIGIHLEQKPEYVEAMRTTEDPLYRRISEALPAGQSLKDFVTSLNVTALKPAAGRPQHGCC
jgi:arsenite methyltransferase